MEPFHVMAFATDIQFINEPLQADEDKRMMDWVTAEYPNFADGLASFFIKDSEVYGSLFSMHLPAHKWWRLAKKKFIARKVTSADKTKIDMLIEFASFCVKLHSCPASSAGLERVFSTFGHIWTKLRNKLGPDKVEQLVKVYRHLNMSVKEECEFEI